MKHPLYNKVESIFLSSVENGKVKHSEFASIRNQASVRAILDDMGYKPNCESKPIIWSKKPVKKKVEPAPVVVEKIRPMKRSTPKYDNFIAKLRAKKPFYIKDVDVSILYAYSIVNDLKKEGWVIKPIKFKAKGDLRAKTIGWQLISEPNVCSEKLGLGQQIKNKLLSGETVFIDDVLISRRAFLNIVGEMRAQGMKFIKTTHKGSTRAFSYQIDFSQTIEA